MYLLRLLTQEKCYKCRNNQGRVFVSHQVTFHEEVFPLKTTQCTSQQTSNLSSISGSSKLILFPLLGSTQLSHCSETSNSSSNVLASSSMSVLTPITSTSTLLSSTHHTASSDQMSSSSSLQTHTSFPTSA